MGNGMSIMMENISRNLKIMAFVFVSIIGMFFIGGVIVYIVSTRAKNQKEALACQSKLAREIATTRYQCDVVSENALEMAVQRQLDLEEENRKLRRQWNRDYSV